MQPAQARPRKTIDDFMGLPQDARAELIAGEIFEMSPSPRYRHQRVLFLLSSRLHDFVAERGLGEICIAPFDVHLPSGDIVEPDIIFVSTRNHHIVADWIHGVPDLLVEVLSRERAERDRIVKRDLYARNGVPEFWIVDPDERTVEVYTLCGGHYDPAGFFKESDRISSRVLAGLNLPVSSVME
jgi:Uma2 family endonuclease